MDTPQSRNEAILQNIMGASNVLPLPQSRIEEILQAILYDESITMEAQSRIEEILVAKLTGAAYTKAPQSRIENLLIEWLQIPVGPAALRTAEGDILEDNTCSLLKSGERARNG